MQLDGFPGCLLYFYTQQHKPSSFGPVLTIPPLLLASPAALTRPLRRSNLPSPPRLYKVIYTRTPREGTRLVLSLEADSLVPMRECVPPAGRRPQGSAFAARALKPPDPPQACKWYRRTATNLQQDRHSHGATRCLETTTRRFDHFFSI